MHWQSLTPLMTGITLSIVCGLAARGHHKKADGQDVFSIPAGIAWLMASMGVLFCIVPFLPGVSGKTSPIHFFWEFAPFWGGAFFAALYFFSYRVIVGDRTFTYGAFCRTAVPFTEVIDFDVIDGKQSSELWVYLKNGKRLKFSGLLGDFYEWVDLVDDRMAGSSGERGDSAAKILDHERRKTGNRNAGRLAYGGWVIVGVFIFILWRMRLL